MPVDYRNYPKNWKTEIRPGILHRASHCCEICGRANREFIVPSRCCKEPLFDERNRCLNCHKPRARIVLTIAHLDHDVTNNRDDNLKALCQRCHLRHDAKLHAENARKTREAKSGQTLLTL